MSRARLLIGAVLVVLGVLFLLDAADVLAAGSVLADWWPVVLIALGAAQLLDRPPNRASGLVFVVAGIVLLMTSLGVFGWGTIARWWPLLLVAAGVWIAFGRSRAVPVGTADEDRLDAIAVASGRELVGRSRTLRGGNLTAILGGIEVDLRSSMPHADGAVLEVTAILAGVDITVPPGWHVDMRGPALFGGYDNATRKLPEPPADAPRLLVRCTVLFGGVDLKVARAETV